MSGRAIAALRRYEITSVTLLPAQPRLALRENKARGEGTVQPAETASRTLTDPFACRNCFGNDRVLESSGGCPALRASPVRRKIVNRRCRTGDCAARASGSVKPVAELNSYWAEAVLCVECRLPGPMQLCASTLESGVRALCSGGHVVLFWPFSECGSRPAARIRDPLCAPPHVH